MSSTQRVARGRVRFAPTTGDAATAGRELDLVDGATIEFGRSERCPLRIGHEPVDTGMPLVAGWLVVAHGRVIVEAAPAPDRPRASGTTTARRALQVTAAGGPPIPVAAGSAYTPAEPDFTVDVIGAHRTWRLEITSRHRVLDEAPVDQVEHDDAIVIDLTDDQRQVLLAYAAPVIAGGVDPATHGEVAAEVHMSRSQVRRHLDHLSAVFHAHRLWSPRSGDTRVRVVEAARHNRLLPRLPTTEADDTGPRP